MYSSEKFTACAVFGGKRKRTNEQEQSIGKYVSLLLQISAVRLPREPSNPERLKGFGYAEFEDLDSLLSALSLNEEVGKEKKRRWGV